MLKEVPDSTFTPLNNPPRPPILRPSAFLPDLELSSLELNDGGDDDAISDCTTCDGSDTESTASSCASACCQPGAKSTSTPVTIKPDDFTPVFVVGAGPHSLALCARLADSFPALLYTDLEHARLSWLHARRPSRTLTKNKPTVKGHWSRRKLVSSANSSPCVEQDLKKVVRVVDESGDGFMARWDQYFNALEIEHLRSPMLFHPSPADTDALVAYARRTGREDELMPIDNVVGKEKSRHERKKRASRAGKTHSINERERQDYYRPSTRLFHDFVRDELIRRYNLDGLVTQGQVTSISRAVLHVQGQDLVDGFLVVVRMPDGTVRQYGSKSVVLAVGPSSSPKLPEAIERSLTVSEQRNGVKFGHAWCHSSAFLQPGFEFLPELLTDKIGRGQETTMVVIGGGLTSAQIADQALSKGVSKVVLVCRGPLKIKHFDMDLEWVSKYNNLSKAAFWQEECLVARHAMIQTARNGGSVNPQFATLLKKHVRAGRLDLRLHTTVQDAKYVDGRWQLQFGNDAIVADYVVCSTGSKLDFDAMDCAKSLGADTVNGLPRLTTDLQLNDDVPVFVMGAYAMLELGPDALNLSGTRHGAERIVHRLVDMGVLDHVAHEDRVIDGGLFGSLGEVEA
ncbi:hypothetical protein OIO90_005408 [Microbotryomycetes sp. JL221]|nr:hypothetical protein OIO90_005408 [Microbotryomycetes sp. JL221]